MSEDYKKIALEDVKKGQRIRIVEEYTPCTAMFEGNVARVSTDQKKISLGESYVDSVTIHIKPDVSTTIFLLEDVPEPKVVRTEVVTITHYDDGTKTETTHDSVPLVIETMEQFEANEAHLKAMILKDADGYYWKHRNEEWFYGDHTELFGMMWNPYTSRGEISDSLPMTIVDNVGD